MSHHYSGPDFSFPRGDARLDFTDLYAFPKPGDVGKSILIINVHPSAGENPPGATTTEPFAPEALYELKIDTDGDGVAEIAYRVRFSAFDRGGQTATLYRADGPQAAGTGDGGRVIVDGAPVSVGREARVTEAGGTRFFAVASRRTMGVSLPASRTLWSTRVDIRPLRQSAWWGHCSRMLCLMTPRARRHFPTTAGRSPTMRSIGSRAFSQMEGSRGIA